METLGYLHLSVCRETAARPAKSGAEQAIRSQPVERSRHSQNSIRPDQRGSGRSIPVQESIYVLMP